jgi:hypothetical protein
LPVGNAPVLLGADPDLPGGGFPAGPAAKHMLISMAPCCSSVSGLVALTMHDCAVQAVMSHAGLSAHPARLLGRPTAGAAPAGCTHGSAGSHCA